jgi:phosphopentomutase
MEKRRAVTVVLDGVGVGALPDAGAYSDEGADTVVHTARAVGGLRLPNLERLGLGNIARIEGVRRVARPAASWGRMAELSPGKDSTSGHLELTGCVLSEPFPLYPNGFPREIIEEFERRTGRSVIGNKPASGTEIIEELGERHLRTGDLIVYTSADSVFQIAAHEALIGTDELYGLCQTARDILVRPHDVARVIARPFVGEPGSFARTKGRRDFSLEPPGKTLLDLLSERGFRVVTVGKIHDLFARRGIDEVIEARGNAEAMAGAGRFVSGGGDFSFLFINLIDFDMLWGHRRDAEGFARGLEEFDAWLGSFIGMLEPGTFFSVTADHGCDPTSPGSDHTREYVPIIAKLVGSDGGCDLGTRSSFADLAASVGACFRVRTEAGESFFEML